ncbi:hypothetical protein ACS8E3_03490 [Psychrobacter sp. 2Y5]|uniref:hypothetical protein n=1 Tax=unclassified Psychrobacter TaxID=196806 RepID=UPI003F457996
MADEIKDLGAGFWNIRGSFKVGGVLDVGAQCSLIKLASGKFIFLDSYELKDDVRDTVMKLTNDGQDVEAVLNVHPFHTVHCEQMAKDFPQATFYGSRRHPEQAPNVDWSDDLVESEAVAKRYPELEFSMPKGIYYIAPDDSVHAGSLLVYHPASKSLHVDDTFMTPPIKLLDAVLPEVLLQPDTKKALKDEPDAAKQYCDWATQLAQDWDVRNFCAAHTHLVKFEQGQFKETLLKTIDSARPKLEKAQ